MPFTHTPTMMVADKKGAWYSRKDIDKLIRQDQDLINANKTLHDNLKTLRAQVKNLRDMMIAEENPDLEKVYDALGFTQEERTIENAILRINALKAKP